MNRIIRTGLLCFLILTGCSPLSRRLSLAERQLTTDPESALATLEDIRVRRWSPRMRARHALLMSLALDKNYIDIADDSLARFADSYYSRHGSLRDRMRARYVLGRVRKNDGRTVVSVLLFQQTEALARVCGDLHYLGLAYRNEGELHGLTHNYFQQEQCYEKALAAFRAAGEDLYADYACLSLARTIGILGGTACSDSLLRHVLARTRHTRLRSEVWRSLAANQATRTRPDPDSVLLYYDRSRESSGIRLTAAEESERALAYAIKGRADSVEVLLSRADAIAVPEEQAVIAHNRARIRILSGKDAGEALLQVNREWNQLFYKDIRTSISSLTSEYYRMEAEQRRYRSYVNALIAASVMILLLAVILMLLRRQRLERQHWDAVFTSASALFREQDDLLTKLIPERIRLLDRLAELYADLDVSDSGLLRRKDRDRREIILSFKEELNTLRNDDSLWESLANVLNREKEGVATLLLKHFPRLDRTDYHLMLLLYAGVKTESVSIICRMAAGTVRQRKSRFLKRIREAELPEADRRILLTRMP